ncbi:MAG: hypothetical protein FJ309_15200 [Planctomycetes bacterium]|nr:hypothetical protein [Planctomycetota bacterium]MBM4013117.1 hypothetical protein [Planctomycetota bacterium]
MPIRQKVPAELAHEIRSELLPRLAALGVALVQADYSGYQGKGGIDMLGFIDQAGAPIDVEQADPFLTSHVRDVLAEFLPDGFEEAEGGQGDLLLEVSTGTFRLDHERNFISTRSSSREWTV